MMNLSQMTFVLGAGSSCPYGMPSGLALIKEFENLIGKENYHRPVDSSLHPLTRQTHEFVRTIKVFNPPSIDIFLDRRPEYSRIGKWFIASVLLPRESDATLLRDHSNDTGGEAMADDWYRWLVGLIIRRAKTVDDICKHFPRIITFNYDRTLERYLWHVLQSFWGLPTDRAWQIVRELPILHVYGMLAKEFAPSTSRFDGRARFDDVIASVSSIRTIYELKHDEKEVLTIREWIMSATRLVFLGFGYHLENIEVLNLVGVAQMIKSGSVQVVSSCFGMALAERNAVVDLLGDPESLGANCYLGLPDEKCLRTLRSGFRIPLVR